MKKLFIVTGASGSGKSAMAVNLPKHLGEGYDVIEFDELGVPSDFTSLRQWVEWRVERTKILMEKGTEEKPLVICGMVIPYEFYRFNDYKGFEVQFAQLMVTPDDLTERLKARNWVDGLIYGNIKCNEYIHWLMNREFEGCIVNTTELSIEETAFKIAEWIKSF